VNCQHEHITTFRFDDGSVAMWGCAECRRRFEPTREWQGLTDEELLSVMQSANEFQGRIAMTWVNHKNETYITDVGFRIASAIEAKLKEKNNQ